MSGWSHTALRMLRSRLGEDKPWLIVFHSISVFPGMFFTALVGCSGSLSCSPDVLRTCWEWFEPKISNLHSSLRKTSCSVQLCNLAYLSLFSVFPRILPLRTFLMRLQWTGEVLNTRDASLRSCFLRAWLSWRSLDLLSPTCPAFSDFIRTHCRPCFQLIALWESSCWCKKINTCKTVLSLSDFIDSMKQMVTIRFFLIQTDKDIIQN